MALNKSIQNGGFGYPNEFLPTEKKLEKEWMLQYFKAAWAEAIAKDGYNLDNRIDRLINARKFYEGLRDIEELKQRFAQSQDLSYLDINHAVSTPTPKLLKIATRTIYNNNYKPVAVPVDSESVKKMGNKRNLILHEMYKDAMRKKIEASGVDGVIPAPKMKLPADERDLDIQMEMNPNIAEAVAMEYLIRQGFKQNDIDIIQKEIAKDLVNGKFAVTKPGFSRDNDLLIEYIDAATFISSYVEKPNFSDARHMGHIMSIPVSQLREMAEGEISEQDLQWIAQNAVGSKDGGYFIGQKRYYGNALDRGIYDNTKVQVLSLQIKQYDTATYVKKPKLNKGFRIEKKSIGYETDDTKKEVMKLGAQVIYEGFWVVGTDYTFGCKRKENSFRERLNGKWFSTALFDYVVYAPGIYDMTNKSLTETAMYHDDQLFLLELKIQQYLITAHPPGYIYNVDAILGAISQMGLTNMKVIDMIKIKAQNGSMYVSSKNEMGELVNGGSGIDPVRKSESGLDQTFVMLLEAYKQRLDILKEAIGVNDAVDGSQPDKKALVGIQKLSAEGHKASLEDLNTAYQYIFKETAKRVYLGFQMQIKDGVNIEEIEASIGRLNIEEIKINLLSKADFSIDVELLPDAYEIEVISQDLQRMVEANMIAPEDKYSVLRVAKESTKKAETLLSFLSRRFREDQQAAAQQNIQLQTEGNAQVAQATAQMEAENIRLRLTLEKEIEALKKDKEIQSINEEWRNKSDYLGIETEAKKELMRLDQELKMQSEEGKIKLQEGLTPPSNSKVGLDKSSFPKIMGEIEPDLGINQPIAP
jgi:hypothetical protein